MVVGRRSRTEYCTQTPVTVESWANRVTCCWHSRLTVSSHKFLVGALFIRVARSISFGLVAHDIDQVADTQIDIDQVQSPLRQHFSLSHNIAGDFVGPRIS